MIECETHSAYLGGKPAKRLYSAVKAVCGNKEGGKSLFIEKLISTFANILYVYRRYLRLSLHRNQVHEMILIPKNQKIEDSGRPTPIHSALIGGTSHSVGLTSPEARHYTRGSKAG